MGGRAKRPCVRPFAEGETPENYSASVEATQKAAIAVLDEFDISSQEYGKSALAANKESRDAVIFRAKHSSAFEFNCVDRNGLERTLLCRPRWVLVKIDRIPIYQWCQLVATGFIQKGSKTVMTVKATAIGRGEDPIQNAIDNLILKLW